MLEKQIAPSPAPVHFLSYKDKRNSSLGWGRDTRENMAGKQHFHLKEMSQWGNYSRRAFSQSQSSATMEDCTHGHRALQLQKGVSLFSETKLFFFLKRLACCPASWYLFLYLLSVLGLDPGLAHAKWALLMTCAPSPLPSMFFLPLHWLYALLRLSTV